jgi:hypoxanthine-guanine phosphoribosyltransferase
MNIKVKIIEAGKTITDVAELLGQKYGKPVSVQNLSQKIRRGTLKISEIEDIADVLGYEVKWVKKDK